MIEHLIDKMEKLSWPHDLGNHPICYVEDAYDAIHEAYQLGIHEGISRAMPFIDDKTSDDNKEAQNEH